MTASLCVCVIAAACAQEKSSPPAMVPAPPEAVPAAGCGVGGNGYLRARARGAVDLDLNWKDADMQCEGGPRPEGRGFRVSIGGPDGGDGRRIRFVFGLGGVAPGAAGEAVPTNVTILFEGEKRIFATQGEDKCTIDSLRQERIGELGEKVHRYRVEARGFCLGPATSLSQGERLFLTSFDFAGRVDFEDDSSHAEPTKR